MIHDEFRRCLKIKYPNKEIIRTKHISYLYLEEKRQEM